MVNEKIFQIMKEGYYWNNTIPQNKDMSVYSDPQDAMDALTYKTYDKWSFVETKEKYNDFFFSSSAVAYGFGLSYSDNGKIIINRVLNNSPAQRAGIKGGYFVTKINGRTSWNESELALLYPRSAGENINIEFLDSAGSKKSRVLVAEEIHAASVSLFKTFVNNGTTYGYIVINSFVNSTPAEIGEAFSYFSSNSVSRIIIDLRYNGGGMVSGAEFLLEAIAPRSALNKRMYKFIYNANYQSYNSEFLFKRTSNLSLDAIYFLTSSNTASASEMAINCIKPYMPGKVFVIGGTTHGKPVGMHTIFHDIWAISPIMFSIYNAKGEGDYFEGIDPDKYVRENNVYAQGNPYEPLLYTALNYDSLQLSTKSAFEGKTPTNVSFAGMRSVINIY